MDEQEALLKRITRGAKYFYDMKPSDFSKRFLTEWNHLMKLCKMIAEYEDSRVEGLVKDTLMRPPVETQQLPGMQDKPKK